MCVCGGGVDGRSVEALLSLLHTHTHDPPPLPFLPPAASAARCLQVSQKRLVSRLPVAPPNPACVACSTPRAHLHVDTAAMTLHQLVDQVSRGGGGGAGQSHIVFVWVVEWS